MKKISVCIATFNGEKFIEQQMASILNQLNEKDEVIVSDDSSTDDTLKILKHLEDSRIKILEGNTFRSPLYNFENALLNATGDIIILSDQDDVWERNKVSEMVELLDKYDVVVCDCRIIDEQNKVVHDSFYKLRNSGPGFFKNLYKNSYIGCCMGFNRKILEYALPFPQNIVMHDMWIGLAGEVFGKTYFSEKKLTLYRRHSSNISSTSEASSYTIGYKIKYRLRLLMSILKRYFERK